MSEWAPLKSWKKQMKCLGHHFLIPAVCLAPCLCCLFGLKQPQLHACKFSYASSLRMDEPSFARVRRGTCSFLLVMTLDCQSTCTYSGGWEIYEQRAAWEVLEFRANKQGSWSVIGTHHFITSQLSLEACPISAASSLMHR